MDTVEVSTLVYVEPEQAFEFLMDFPGYAQYSEYLTEVHRDGDGSPGTRYGLTFAWWKLSYTARSEVEAVDPPNAIEWRVVKDVDAHGRWDVEPEPESAPDGEETATRVRLTVEFDGDSVGGDILDLPRFVSMDRVVSKVVPLIEEEAERVVRRIVADLEGEPREVDLLIHEAP